VAELDRPLKKAFSGEGLLADEDAAKARDARAGWPAGNLWKRHLETSGDAHGPPR
jgi:hypothetical protein